MVSTFFKVCFTSCQDGRLKKGDQLIAVDNQPIVGLSHAEVSCVKCCLSKLQGENVAVSTITSETKTRAPSFTSWLRGMKIMEVFVILIKNRTQTFGFRALPLSFRALNGEQGHY